MGASCFLCLHVHHTRLYEVFLTGKLETTLHLAIHIHKECGYVDPYTYTSTYNVEVWNVNGRKPSSINRRKNGKWKHSFFLLSVFSSKINIKRLFWLLWWDKHQQLELLMTALNIPSITLPSHAPPVLCYKLFPGELWNSPHPGSKWKCLNLLPSKTNLKKNKLPGSLRSKI